MPYVCGKCGREITSKGMDSLPGVKCPHCGYRILYKVRPPVVKKTIAK
ncbi:MAG: Rpo12/RPC10 RNA polymerase subunit family protein [Candidatus Helarchaeota archaeon]